MPGGEMQLAFKAAQDEYLTGSPQMSFFNSVYKQYTDLAMEIIQLDEDNSNTTLSNFQEEFIIKYKIPRNASLLTQLFVEFQLPAIYSSDAKQFQWIRRLGEYLIKEFRLVGSDGRVYSRIRSEAMHLNAELTRTRGQLEQYYEMIGHVPALYDPAASAGGIYPARPLPSSGDTGIPSIAPYRVMVPIPYWGGKFANTPIPLCALREMELRIELTLRPLSHVYTVLDTDPTNTTYGTRIRPINAGDYLSSFTNTTTTDTLSTVSVNVYGNYIFLSNEEQNALAAKSEFRILIGEFFYVDDIKDRGNGGTFRFDIRDINQPVRELHFMMRRQDNEDTNQWDNYTIWEYGSTPALGNGGKVGGGELANPLRADYLSEYNNAYSFSNLESIQTELYQPNIITDVELILNGENRFKLQPHDFFAYNHWQHNPSYRPDGLRGMYGYSFAIKNGIYQPTGSCNFSAIGRKELRLTTKSLNNITRTQGQSFSGNYRVIVIAENWNIFSARAGMAGVEFAA